MTEKPEIYVTRIDLIRNTRDNTLLREWADGWKSGDAPDRERMGAGSLMECLNALEDKGWSVTQYDNDNAQALRGTITRIDFIVRPQGLVCVKKFPNGWMAKTRPMKTETKPLDLETAIAWCLSHGYTVRRWEKNERNPAGARAWLGTVQPVRSTSEIQRLRRVLNESRNSGDYALDFE